MSLGGLDTGGGGASHTSAGATGGGLLDANVLAPERSEASPADPLEALETTLADAPAANGSNGVAVDAQGNGDSSFLGEEAEHGRQDRRYRLRRLLAISDMVALGVAFAASEALTLQFGSSDVLLRVPAFLPLLLLAWLFLATVTGAYHTDERRLECTAADEVSPVLRVASMYGWLVLGVGALVASPGEGLMPAVAWAVLTIPIVVAGRSITRMLARRRPWYREKVLIVGGRQDAYSVARRLARHPEYGIGVIGRLDLFPARFNDADWIGLHTDIPVCPEASPGRHMDLGLDADCGHTERVAALLFFVERFDADRVIFASSPERLDDRTGVLRRLCERGVKVDLVPGGSESFRANAELHHVEGLPLLTLPSARKPRSGLALKRAVDIAASSTALLLLSPLFAYCAIRIKRGSPGPVFFRQRRIGHEGNPIEILKFRTMIDGADARKHEVAELNHHEDGQMFKIPEDPRVTAFGAKLRRASLDELPQLWNVLKGEMSLVGPRPLIPEEAELVTSHHRARFRLRPGITGRWQVLGRSDIPFEDMVNLDYTYVTNWSLGEDLRLMAHTVGTIAAARGAY